MRFRSVVEPSRIRRSEGDELIVYSTYPHYGNIIQRSALMVNSSAIVVFITDYKGGPPSNIPRLEYSLRGASGRRWSRRLRESPQLPNVLSVVVSGVGPLYYRGDG